jgi:hypothetical protein
MVPHVILDADGHVDHIVSQAIFFLELLEDLVADGATLSGNVCTSGYAATFYPGDGYYDTVLADFDDTSQSRFHDSEKVETSHIQWEYRRG